MLFDHEGKVDALFVTDLATGRLAQIGPRFHYNSAFASDPENELQPDWAASGRIVFTEHPGRGGHVRSELAVMSATGKHLRMLTSGHFDTSPSWSPDGARLAFVRSKDFNDQCPKVYTVRADGGNLRRVANGCYTGVAWSPDGAKLAAVRYGGQERADELVVMPARGGPAQRIAHVGIDDLMENLDWQPLPR
jgi:Tol biopolymer transport system component